LRGELHCYEGDFTWGALNLPTGSVHEDEEEDPWMEEDEWEHA
jgi:hypothetical protein